MNDNIEPGDWVRLKDGSGAAMQIEAMHLSSENRVEIHCVWTVDGERYGAVTYLDQVEKIESPYGAP